VCGALDVPAVAARPHPRAILRRNLSLEDATDNDAIFEHVASGSMGRFFDW